MGQVPDKDVHGSVAAVAKRQDTNLRLDACAAGLDDLRRRFDALERRTMADEMPNAPKRCDSCGQVHEPGQKDCT